MKKFPHIVFTFFLGVLTCYAASTSDQASSILPTNSQRLVKRIEKPIVRFLRRVEETQNIQELHLVANRAAAALGISGLTLSNQRKNKVPLQYKELFEKIGQQGRNLLGERFEDLLVDLSCYCPDTKKVIEKYAMPVNELAVLEEQLLIRQFLERLMATQTLTELYLISTEASKIFAVCFKLGKAFESDYKYARFLPIQTLIHKKGEDLLGPDRFKSMQEDFMSNTRLLLKKYEQGLDIKIQEYITRIKNSNSVHELLFVNEEMKNKLPYCAHKMVPDLSTTVQYRGSELVGSDLFNSIINANPSTDPIKRFLEAPMECLTMELEKTESADDVLNVINRAVRSFGYSVGFNDITSSYGPLLFKPLKERMIQRGQMFAGEGFLKKTTSSSNHAHYAHNHYLAPDESILVKAFKKRINATTTHRQLYIIAKEASEKLDKNLTFGSHTYGPFRPLQKLIIEKGRELLGEKNFDKMYSIFAYRFSPEEILEEYDPTIDHSELHQKINAFVGRLHEAQTIRTLFEIAEQADTDLHPPILFSELNNHEGPLKYTELYNAITTCAIKLIGRTSII